MYTQRDDILCEKHKALIRIIEFKDILTTTKRWNVLILLCIKYDFFCFFLFHKH